MICNGLQELGFDYKATTPSDINHDVLFREGETRQVRSFLPELQNFN